MSEDRCQFCYCRAVNPFGVDGGYTCSDCMSKYMDRVELPDTGKIIASLTRERDQLKARAEKAEGDARWVPCSERMPKNNTAVMVCCPSANDDDGEGTFVASGFVLPDGEWQSQDSIQKSHPIPWPVTHWRPLPGPPKPHTEPTP